MKSKRTSDGRKHDHGALQVMRQQAVKAIREGQDVSSVAAAYGINVRSVFRWLADFANGGQNALLAKPIPGRPRKVSAEEMRWLAQAVRQHPAAIQVRLWLVDPVADRGADRARIRQEAVARLGQPGHEVAGLLGTEAALSGVATRRDAGAGLGSQNLPGDSCRSQSQRATIFFADESGIRSDYRTGTASAPVGETPVVEVTGRRFWLNRFRRSAHSAKSVSCFMTVRSMPRCSGSSSSAS